MSANTIMMAIDPHRGGIYGRWLIPPLTYFLGVVNGFLSLIRGRGLIGWRISVDRLEVFEHILRSPHRYVQAHPDLPMRQLMEYCVSLKTHFNLWMVEGMGWEKHYEQAGFDASEEDFTGINSQVTVLMYLGKTLTLTKVLLEKFMLTKDLTEERIIELTKLHFKDALAHTQPDYCHFIVFEGTGMFSRLFFGPLCHVHLTMAKTIREVYGRKYEMDFYHGVGRATFFNCELPSVHLKGPFWSFERIAMETGNLDPQARFNVYKGHVFPLSAIYMRNPEIYEYFLETQSPGFINISQAVKKSLATSLMVKRAIVGEDKLTRDFIGHIPQPKNQKLWEDYVLGPAEDSKQLDGSTWATYFS